MPISISTGRKMQMFLLDLLYVEYFKRTRETSMANRTATADAVSQSLPLL